MKKRFAFFCAAIVSVFMIAACGGDETESKTNDNASVTDTQEVQDDNTNTAPTGTEGGPCLITETGPVCEKGLRCYETSDGFVCLKPANSGSDSTVATDEDEGVADEVADELVDSEPVDEDIVVADETGDNIVTDEVSADVDETVTDEVAGDIDNAVTDTAIPDESPDVDSNVGNAPGAPCYFNLTCNSLKGLVCIEGICELSSTDVDTVSDDDVVDVDSVDADAGTDADALGTDELLSDVDEVIADEAVSDVDVVDQDSIVPDQDVYDPNHGDLGQLCYENKTCNIGLVPRESDCICRNYILPPEGFEDTCWDWRDAEGITTCELQGDQSPAMWLAKNAFPYCFGSTGNKPRLAVCRAYKASTGEWANFSYFLQPK